MKARYWVAIIGVALTEYVYGTVGALLDVPWYSEYFSSACTVFLMWMGAPVTKGE